MSKNNTIILIVVIVLLVIGAIALTSSTATRNTLDIDVPGQNTGIDSEDDVVIINTTSTTTATTTLPSIKSFTVNGKDFSFSPSTITVKKNDRVKITLNSTQGFHDLKIDGYNVATPQIQTGGTATVEFTADKAGSFEYYCTVGQHRAMGMKGTLVVTE